MKSILSILSALVLLIFGISLLFYQDVYSKIIGIFLIGINSLTLYEQIRAFKK